MRPEPPLNPLPFLIIAISTAIVGWVLERVFGHKEE